MSDICEKRLMQIETLGIDSRKKARTAGSQQWIVILYTLQPTERLLSNINGRIHVLYLYTGEKNDECNLFIPRAMRGRSSSAAIVSPASICTVYPS